MSGAILGRLRRLAGLHVGFVARDIDRRGVLRLEIIPDGTNSSARGVA
jgi:hypothetical protein